MEADGPKSGPHGQGTEAWMQPAGGKGASIFGCSKQHPASQPIDHVYPTGYQRTDSDSELSPKDSMHLSISLFGYCFVWIFAEN